MWKRFSALIVSVAILTVSFEARAAEAPASQDANDLFELYNKERAEQYEQSIEGYQELKEKYENAQADIKNKEVFNTLYEAAKKKQEEQLKELDKKVNKLLSENKDISKQVEESFDDWDKLMSLDRQYKINMDTIDGLLKERNTFVLVDRKEINYDALDEIEVEFKEAEDKYEATGEISVLGEVTNVRFPLGNDTIVTSPFGDRIDPMTGVSIRFHAGIDLRASIGTEVLSIFNGTVADTGYGPQGGYFVKVNHGNGIMSYYCHLDEIRCEVGQKVSQYDVIAASGNTGSRTTGPHLHFGLYIDGNPVDPGVLFKDRG